MAKKKTKKEKIKPLTPEQEAYQSLLGAVEQLSKTLKAKADSVHAAYKTSGAPTDFSKGAILDEVVVSVDSILANFKPVS